ncbi:uncharacterized [Tachysurus ichikawai]
MIGGVGGTGLEKLLKTTVFVFLSSEITALCLGPNIKTDSGGFTGLWAVRERVGQERVGERRLVFPPVSSLLALR